MIHDKIRQVSKTNLLVALVAGGAVAIGGYTLFISRAATPFAAVEAEQGTVASGTTVINDTTASASKAIQFAAAATPPPVTPPPTPPPATGVNLDDPAKKEIAMELVSSAENSSLNWKAQYGYLEDIGDGRGYTGGIVGFTSGTGDMLELVQYYKTIAPAAGLLTYLPALQKVNGTASHTGLGAPFESSWKASAANAAFKAAQDHERDRVYFNPAVAQGKADGLHALGQFIYYDALVMHGPGNDSVSFGGIRANALKKAKTPAQGGNETTYLNAFLDVRKAAMLTEAAHDDTSRVDTEQRLFLSAGNLNLNTPLSWKTYGDPYTIK
jgi:chitosanase